MVEGIMLFSIVIPAFNAALFVTKALDSVREQTFTDIEVLVTNDGSTDETEKVLVEYAQMFPGFPLKIASQSNKGIGGARNNGIFRASGEFIAFLDADDHWYPAKLQQVRDVIERNPSIDIVCHDELEIRHDGRTSRSHYGTVAEPAYEDLLFNGNRLSTSATVVRRSLAYSVGGFSDNLAFNSAEDYEFWLRLARSGGRFYYLPEVLGEYRRVEGSITSRIEYHCRNAFNVIEHHVEYMKREMMHPQTVLDEILKRKKMESLIGMATSFLRCGDNSKARTYYLNALAIKRFNIKAIIGLTLSFVDLNGRIINKIS